MPTNELIKQYIVSEILSEGDQDNALKDSDSLIESGIIDSMGIISILSFIEERFSIEISSEELLPENFDSINAITTLVSNKVSN